jgi:hemin uptake protein HemP
MQARPMQRAEELNQSLEPVSRMPRGVAVYSTENLFNGGREIEIEHNGEIYRLRITRQGKLILNK